MKKQHPSRDCVTAGAAGKVEQQQIILPSLEFQEPSTTDATQPSRRTANSHLHLLAPGTDRFTFQSYTDCREKRDGYKAQGKRDPFARILHGTLAQHWDELARLSTAGAGICVTVNETNLRGRSAADIVCVRAYFSDLDGAPLANLRRVTLCPHFVVHTSADRFHSYWCIEGASLSQFRPIQQRLAKLIEGDPSVCDLPRPLRLAGFPNQKDPARPFPVAIATVSYAPQSPYSDADFQAALAAAEKHHAQLTTPAERLNVADRLLASLPPGPPDMRQGYPDGQRTHELTRRAGWCLGARNMTEGETVAACLEWNQFNTPPLPDEKVRSTVASIAKAEAKKRQAEESQQSTNGAHAKTRGTYQQAEEDNQSKDRADESQSSDDALIDELASLSIIAYAKRRKEAAKQLGIGVTKLDKAVERRRAELEGEARAEPSFLHWTVEPSPEPVDGDALILALVRRIQSHVVMTPEAALTGALWIMFAWVHEEAATHSPILMATSPEAECGKTTLLGLVGFLVPRSLPSVGISPTALFRAIEKWQPTLIIDEADVAFVQNEDLRAVVNSGWTRGQGVVRCDGDDNEPRVFSTFCPKAIGLKGKKLPDTTASRAIVIELKRKLAHENVADFRHVDDHGLKELRQQLSRWAIDNAEALRHASPTLPLGFANRLAANWHLLLAIAEAAGGEWPEKAREAAATLAKLKATLDASIGIQLLSDIRDAFGSGTDRFFSSALIDKLIADPEGTWAGYNRGKPFSQKQLASRLRAYGILSETVWIDKKSAKGYYRAAFEDVWTRYLQA